MANISSLGVGAGIDLNSLLTKLMASESVPITQLNAKQASYQSQLSAYGRIQSAVETLTTAAKAIGSASTFKGFQATVADTTYATATATSYAAPGTFSLRVDKLAQANKLQSGVNPSVAAGTLSIELGDISSGSFVAKSGTSPVPVTFTGSTLEDLRAAINSANTGTTATIVNGSAGPQLMLTSNETGAANSIKITGSGGLSGLTYDPTAPSTAFTEKAAAQDAVAQIDGVAVKSATNTLTEVMTGVSITLNKVHDPLQPTDATTLTIGNDTTGMTTRVNAFVTAWNNLNTLAKGLTQYDPTSNTGSTLSGDGTIRSVVSQLRDILFSAPSGASSQYPRLADLGVAIQSDGSLSLDSTKLSTAIATNLSAVTATVNAFGSAFQTTAAAMTSTGGTISNREDALNTIIKGMDSRREALQRRIDAVQARYQKQFTNLDVLMGQMQTQSTYLTQQLAKL
ncbi:MAG: flagellar filament capping protein FliD [Bacteroidota bacterium]